MAKWHSPIRSKAMQVNKCSAQPTASTPKETRVARGRCQTSGSDSVSVKPSGAAPHQRGSRERPGTRDVVPCSPLWCQLKVQQAPGKGKMISLAGLFTRFLNKKLVKTKPNLLWDIREGPLAHSQCKDTYQVQQEEDHGPQSICTKIYPVHNISYLEGFNFINETKIIQASQN